MDPRSNICRSLFSDKLEELISGLTWTPIADLIMTRTRMNMEKNSMKTAAVSSWMGWLHH